MYGSIRSPVTLNLLCTVFKVSPRSSPTLVSLDANRPMTVSDLGESIDSGFFELVCRRDIPFDPILDILPPLPRYKKVHRDRVIESKEQSLQSQNATYPIPEDEMSLAIRAMLHVISSIPPRYLKFNVILSNQVERAIAQVDQLQKVLSDLSENNDGSIYRFNQSKKIPLDLAIHKTFIQYRILNILHQTWTKAWERVSPTSRYFSISDIKVLDSIDLSEHYLNRLNSWRRILETDTWNALMKHVAIPQCPDRNPRKKIYNPSGPPSGKNPRSWTYLARPSTSPALKSNHDIPVTFLDPKETLNAFRNMYIDSMKTQKITKQEELNFLLIKMLQLDTQFKTMSAHEKIVYPTDYVKNAIKKEFRLQVN